MPKGELEVIEYVPRQVAMADALPPDHAVKSEDLWSRLRLEHRTLTSCAAALAAVALHALLIAPALWAGGGSRDPQERMYQGATDMQWVVLNNSSDRSAATLPALPSLALSTIGVTDALPTFPLTTPSSVGASDAGSDHSDSQAGLGAMYGRYVGQIHARIDRAWQRPRTAIGAPIFQCQVQVDQDPKGRVEDVTLVQCNGDGRWRLSLVHAIEVASPLPAPPNPAVFARHVLLEFRAMAYSSGAQAALYEPPGELAMDVKPVDGDTQSQNAFRALRDAVRAPNSRRVIELRIEGSKAEVEPERQ